MIKQKKPYIWNDSHDACVMLCWLRKQAIKHKREVLFAAKAFRQAAVVILRRFASCWPVEQCWEYDMTRQKFSESLDLILAYAENIPSVTLQYHLGKIRADINQIEKGEWRNHLRTATSVSLLGDDYFLYGTMTDPTAGSMAHTYLHTICYVLGFDAYEDVMDDSSLHWLSSQQVREQANEAKATEHLVQANILREVFGPQPLRTAELVCGGRMLSWNNGVIPGLARQIRKENTCDLYPVLADALEDAGCTDMEFVAHCRECYHEPAGCWVLRAILEG